MATTPKRLGIFKKSIFFEKQNGKMQTTPQAQMVKSRFMYQVWQKSEPTIDSKILSN
jgi:hypothetical protein